MQFEVLARGREVATMEDRGAVWYSTPDSMSILKECQRNEFVVTEAVGKFRFRPLGLRTGIRAALTFRSCEGREVIDPFYKIRWSQIVEVVD